MNLQLELAIKRNRGIRRAFDKIVDDILDTIESLSPVETGEYRSSHRKRRMPDVDGLPSARIGTDDPVAGFIEYGTEDTPEFAVYRKTVALFS